MSQSTNTPVRKDERGKIIAGHYGLYFPNRQMRHKKVSKFSKVEGRQKRLQYIVAANQNLNRPLSKLIMHDAALS